MKIVKEVIISASMNDIWPWLSSESMIKNYWDAKGPLPSFAQARMPEGEPPLKLAVRTPAIAPSIVTTLELSERGKRSGLRVTITGWDDIEPDKARLRMPQVSLDWERKLSYIKKKIESTFKSQSRGQ
jgi:hypothetical protein